MIAHMQGKTHARDTVTHNMMFAIRPTDSIVNLEINMLWDALCGPTSS